MLTGFGEDFVTNCLEDRLLVGAGNENHDQILFGLNGDAENLAGFLRENFARTGDGASSAARSLGGVKHNIGIIVVHNGDDEVVRNLLGHDRFLLAVIGKQYVCLYAAHGGKTDAGKRDGEGNAVTGAGKDG